MDDLDSGASSYEPSEHSAYSSDEDADFTMVEGPKGASYPWPEGKVPARDEQIESLAGGDYRLLDLVPQQWVDAIGLETLDMLLGRVQPPLVASLKRDVVYPDPVDYFRVLDTPPSDARVVILGQNPYHGPSQAHGLAFSDASGGFAPSLRNMVTVIRNNGYECDPDRRSDGLAKGNLTPWQDQGVFLLNTGLSVIKGEGSSHMDLGWQEVTDAIISVLASTGPPKVFCLWGKPAQRKSRLIESKAKKARLKHLILMTSHPSPLSFHRGFKDCTHFSETNSFLRSEGFDPIDWNLCE
jgi:uracil-DNA glycosylase